MPTLYIANGLGFSTLGRTRVLASIIEAVKKLGFGVIEPFADNNELSLANDRSVGAEIEIAVRDMNGVIKADGVLCVLSSPIPDEGSMIEVGMALALKKPVFYLNDDFRYQIDPASTKLPVNLMLFAHATAKTWQRYYYTSIEDLSSQEKGLCKWIQHSQKTVAEAIAE